MLTLSRKPGQSIVIGNNIVVTVRELRGRTVRLSVEAPEGMSIYREEVYSEIAAENRRAAQLQCELDTRLVSSVAALTTGMPSEKG